MQDAEKTESTEMTENDQNKDDSMDLGSLLALSIEFFIK